MSSRRTLLKAGAGAALAGTGALAWRAWDQGVFSTGQGPAYEAWNQWDDGPADAPQRLVAAAILAANPHNTQPWRFRIAPGVIDLFADRARNIGAIDPYLREMHVGFGCALENLLLAASASGWAPQLMLFPDAGNPDHVARVALVRAPAAASPLFAAIPERHTNRGAYLMRPLEPSVFAALDALRADLPLVSVRWLTNEPQRRTIGARIVEAAQAIVADSEQSRDSGAWFRNTWHEVQARRDGLTIDAQALPGWLRVAAKILPPVSSERADRIWLDATRDVHVATAPAFGLLLARDASDNVHRVQGGRLWQRMHLWAQTQGIAMHPLNQMPERADRERSAGLAPRFQGVLNELVGQDGWQVLMPFRLGHPTVPALRSPRRQVSEVLVG
jgi:nitroreductase